MLKCIKKCIKCGNELSGYSILEKNLCNKCAVGMPIQGDKMKSKKQGLIDKIKNKDGADKKDYTCGYCGHKFSKYVAKAGSEKHSSASTQVCCPGCRNLLKTWD